MMPILCVSGAMFSGKPEFLAGQSTIGAEGEVRSSSALELIWAISFALSRSLTMRAKAL